MVKILLDSGSKQTFISEKLANNLNMDMCYRYLCVIKNTKLKEYEITF